jgi:hypothetical protein
MSTQDWKASGEELELFHDAASAATTRVRQVLIVMSTASIIMFAAEWNTFSFGWMSWRAKVSTGVEVWLTYQEDEKERKRWDAVRAKVESKSATPVEQEQLKHWETFRALGEKYAGRVFLPLPQVKEQAKKHREAMVESAAVIKIPFFGIVLDANDSTLIGGFTLCIIMMWLRLSLWRQCSNLSIAFSQAAATGRLQFSYRYLAMQQVLSVPPATADADRARRPKHGAPPYLFLLPAIVQAVALVNDLVTFDLVSRDDTFWHALLQTLVGFGFLAVLIHLTLHCLKLRAEGTRIWQLYFARLGPGAEVPQ